MRQPRAPRVARGVLAASIATFAALLSHVVAGGELPGWTGIVVPWVLSVTVCTLLAGRALSALRLGIAVAVSQLLFHTLFVVGSAAAPPVGARAGHAHHGSHDLLTLASSSVDTAGAAVPSTLAADPAMWASHALAAAVTFGALYRGEQAARALLRAARELVAWAHRALSRHRVPLIAAVRPVPVVVTATWVPVLLRLLPALCRRGPPSPIVL